MTPYYDHKGITIYHGDCREIIPYLEPVNLVLTDPPYNVGIDFGKNTNDLMPPDQYEEWCLSWFEMFQSHGILLTPGIGNLGMWMKKNPRWIIAWVKDNSMKRITIGFNCWEPILLWGQVETKLYRDVIVIPTIPQLKGHPTPKPLKLFSKLIDGFSNGTVLDPFLGSGTTLVAAKQLNRKAIGIEIEEKYC